MESQKKYFREYIERNPLWELIEIYCDEGITGTSTKKRDSFNKMIEDACNHRFDLIITKEISRFARNTLDSIYFTRKLKECGVGVIFMSDNINTLDADAELRLTIMSSIAQEESRKTSERVKWGQKRRMEQGVVFGRDLLGYDVRDGKLYLNTNGAVTVNLIFHKFLNEGKGSHVIAKELREAGIPTAAYMKNWNNTTILRILRNEKYCGDLIQKKTLTPSYLNHEKKYNRGQEEYVILRKHHEPIISRELFEKTQQELMRRSPSSTQKAKHSNRYCFSGKIKCGVCGSSYVARVKKRNDNSIYKAWRCYKATVDGKKHMDKAGNEIGCDNRSINEDDLKKILQQVIKNLPIDTENAANQLCAIIKSVTGEKDSYSNAIQQVDTLSQSKKRQSLIELYLNNDINIDEFRKLTLQIESENSKVEFVDSIQNKIPDIVQEDIYNVIKKLVTGELWDDTFYKNILDRVIVHINNTVEVYIQLLPYKLSYLIC